MTDEERRAEVRRLLAKLFLKIHKRNLAEAAAAKE
jgi:hypothetical protein